MNDLILKGVAVYGLFGVAAMFDRRLRTTMDDIRSSMRVETKDENNLGGPAISFARIAALKGLLYLLVVLGWPLALVMVRITGVGEIKCIPWSVKPHRLRFDGMNGMGTLECLECGRTTEMLALLHGHEEPGEKQWYEMGMQCQTCGDLVRVECGEEPTGHRENCAGILSRSDDVFCPMCKSKRVKYDAEWIT